jgi:hypothetical protein
MPDSPSNRSKETKALGAAGVGVAGLGIFGFCAACGILPLAAIVGSLGVAEALGAGAGVIAAIALAAAVVLVVRARRRRACAMPAAAEKPVSDPESRKAA